MIYLCFFYEIEASALTKRQNQLQGFAELEYGMLRYMGAIDDSTPIVTSGSATSLHLSFFNLLFLCIVLSNKDVV